MVRQIQSGSAIAKQSPEQSLTPRQAQAAIIGKYLYKFAALDRNRAVDEELIGIFVDALEDMDVKALERGLKAHLKEGTRFPWPSEIRELGEL